MSVCSSHAFVWYSEVCVSCMAETGLISKNIIVYLKKKYLKVFVFWLVHFRRKSKTQGLNIAWKLLSVSILLEVIQPESSLLNWRRKTSISILRDTWTLLEPGRTGNVTPEVAGVFPVVFWSFNGAACTSKFTVSVILPSLKSKFLVYFFAKRVAGNNQHLKQSFKPESPHRSLSNRLAANYGLYFAEKNQCKSEFSPSWDTAVVLLWIFHSSYNTKRIVCFSAWIKLKQNDLITLQWWRWQRYEMLLLCVKNQTETLKPGNSNISGDTFESATTIAVKLNFNLLIIMLKIQNPDP